MIPDEEPWWMVRRSMNGDGSVAAAAMTGDGSVAAAESPVRELSPVIAEPASETERTLDSLPFRPFGYEW